MEEEQPVNCLKLSVQINHLEVDPSRKFAPQTRDARAMVLPSFAERLPVVRAGGSALYGLVVLSPLAGAPELVDRDCGGLDTARSLEEFVEAIRAAPSASVEELDLRGEVGCEKGSVLQGSRVYGERLNELSFQAVEIHE